MALFIYSTEAEKAQAGKILEFSGLLCKQTVSCDAFTVSIWRHKKYLDESHI